MSGLTVWLTGLSGAGKTSLAIAAGERLRAHGRTVELLDGDVVRRTLGQDLDFSRAGRDENVRRIGELAERFTTGGALTLVAAISPYRDARARVRARIGRFLEVFVNAPLEVCEARDPKGLYRRARLGELRGFTGIDDPYEPPLSPDLELRTDLLSLDDAAALLADAALRALSAREDAARA